MNAGNLHSITSNPSVVIEGTIISVLREDIEPDPKQPRVEFDLPALQELAASLQAVGQLVPVFLRVHPEKLGKYILVDGERRWRSSALVGMARLNAIVIAGDEAELFIQSVIANFARVGLTHLEAAKSIARIKKLTHENSAQVAKYFGQSPGWVDHHLSLLRLPESVHRLMGPPYPLRKRLPFSIALLLVSLPKDDQVELAYEFHANGTKFGKAKLIIEQRKITTRTPGAQQPGRQRDHYRSLRLFLENVSEGGHVLLARAGNSFEEILKNRTAEECQALIALAEASEEELFAIKRAIEQARRKKIIGSVK